MSGKQLKMAAETLVLVHGLGLTRHSMWLLGKWIARAETRVVNWSYPSLRGPVERFGEQLSHELRRLDRSAAGPIHVVCHSLGCIVTRAALVQDVPQHRGRVVMLTPPNRGSDVCEMWIGRIARRWIPAAVQLSSIPESYVNALPGTVDLDCGIIAARWDLLVPDASTHLDGEQDHVVVPTLHTGVLVRRDVARLARHFLDHGRFRGAESFRAA